MDATEIVNIILRRRNEFWDRQLPGTESDHPVYSDAGHARGIVDEYDSLLIEIGAIQPHEAKSA